MAVKQPSVLRADDLNDADEEILDALWEGRGTPSYLAERLDRNRSYVSQRLKRLAEHDVLDKLGTGLYELVDDPRAEEDEQRPNVDTRDIVDDWLWEHYGFGVEELDDLDPDRACEALEEAQIHFSNLNRDELGDALGELAAALGVERDG